MSKDFAKLTSEPYHKMLSHFPLSAMLLFLIKSVFVTPGKFLEVIEERKAFFIHVLLQLVTNCQDTILSLFLFLSQIKEK